MILDCDWGMKNRLGKMFDPRSGNTVMLAFDHGYIMGPTAGLERIDLVIPPLIPHVNVLMGTRGMIRSCISPAAPVAKCVRVIPRFFMTICPTAEGSPATLKMPSA